VSDAEAYEAALSTAWLGRSFAWHEALGSTNTEALRWAANGAPHGSLIVADDQQRGKGRLGRVWRVEPGANVTASFVLKAALTPRQLALLPLTTGLAVAESLGLLGIDAALKWPNDVLVGGRKVCGVLVERRLGAGGETGSLSDAAVVVGIGLNVNQRAFPPELAGKATSLAAECGRRIDRAALLASLTNVLERRFDQLLAGAAEALIRAYRERLAWLGTEVALCTPEGTALAEGVLAGVDDEGALLVGTASGLRRVVSGELSLRKR
jgi:BirA family biotin operon repressor/biotin-[acetyl-CoA-carboxylase] ligase